MKLKRLLAILVILSVTFTVCACGGSGSGKTSADKTSATDTSVNSAEDSSTQAGDTSSGPQHTVHMDDDEDGICDICGASLVASEQSINGNYVLDKKISDGKDVTDNYYLCVLVVSDEKATLVEVDYCGKVETVFDSSFAEGELTLKLGFRTQKYAFDEEAGELNFNGRYGGHDVNVTYVYDKDFVYPADSGSVEFTDELFGDDINENFYNYCPTMLMEGNDTMHIWYCSNKISGNVTDYIAYRKGTLHADGKWTFTEKSLVLEAGSGNAWDSRHCCDPAVIKGEFKYNGETYSYLMAYLGCLTSDCTCNEVGIAVARSPEGPWVTYGDNPIANYRTSLEFDASHWGYGQPSLVSVDKKGKVILFYTKGIKLGTYTWAEMWDLYDLNAPIKMKESKLVDGGAIETFNNADFAYDPVGNNFYCIKEDHVSGWYPSDGGVDWISGSNSVFYTGMSANDELVGDTLFNNAPWTKVGTVGKELTGFDRNHNAGILTDEYGWIMDNSKIPVVYTMSYLMTDYPDWNKGGQWPALHTYRLHGVVLAM